MNDVVILDDMDKKLCIEYLYCVEDYYTMTFKVQSSKFRGESNFCISKQELVKIIEYLNVANKELKGNVQISDSDSDSYINITVKNTGRLMIDGQIGGSFEDNYIKFKYESDQTIISNLIRFFKYELNV